MYVCVFLCVRACVRACGQVHRFQISQCERWIATEDKATSVHKLNLAFLGPKCSCPRARTEPVIRSLETRP